MRIPRNIWRMACLSVGVMCVLPGVLSAQTDSLRLRLAGMPDDTIKTRAIYAFLKANQGLPPDTIFVLANEGRELAQQIDDTRGIALLDLFLGFSRIDVGEVQAAGPYFEEAADIHLASKDTLNWARMLINQGMLHYSLGNDDQALSHYQQAAAAFDQIERPNAALFNNMAIIYRKQEKYESAFELYERSFELKEEASDSLGMAATLMNLGLLQGYLGDSTQALKYELQALTLYESLGREADVASTQVALGNIYLNLGQLDEAEQFLIRAYTYLRAHPESAYYYMVLYDLGEVSEYRNDWSDATAYYEQALTAVRSSNRITDIQIISKKLSRALHEQGKNAEAWPLLWESLSLKDTLTRSERLALTEEMQARFEVDQAEATTRLQAAAFQQEQRFTWGLLGLLGLIIAGSLYFLYDKNRSNQLLKGKNQVIEQALLEKEALMREMHHRVKNNLQFISSLLRLQTRHIVDEQAQEALLSSRSRVLSMALIHRHLYQEGQVTAIQVDTYLDRLVTELMTSLSGSENQVHLQADFAPLLLDVDQAVPLGLIVNELVCNAMKYAFTDGKAGELAVSLKQVKKTLVLCVADDGPGMASPDPEADASFGYRLIRLLAEKLDAQLSISSENGTRVQLTIPEPILA